MIIVYGNASSGKSNIAENLAVEIGQKRRTSLVYIATMESDSQEAKQRIRRHRAQREGKGFYTIEEPYRLVTHVMSVSNKTVLLECLSNYCANVYFKALADKAATESDIEKLSNEIVSQIIKLSDSSYELVIVSNDLFSDGMIYDSWTESYLKLLATVNIRLTKICDSFIEVINGIPILLKGDGQGKL